MTSGKDWALLLQLLGDSGGVQGRTRLQKMVFLAKKEQRVPFSMKFSVYYYGPYSEGLQDAIDQMVANGLVEEEKYPTPTGDEGYMYTLTQQGSNLLGQVVSQLKDSERRGIREIVSRYGQKPLRRLLDHVYSNYVNKDQPAPLP
jgi:uncharacterized protein